MTGDPEAQRRLEKLHAELRAFRDELEIAEREDLRFIAERAAHEIRKLHDSIRRHCDAHGLALPLDVPAED